MLGVVKSTIGLPIHHIGHNSFFSNSRVLHLKILLHVPSITKNLISVSQFCSDNNVFFEFHSTACFVKDQATKRVLLEGAVDGGLYKFHLIKTNFQQLRPLFSDILLNQSHLCLLLSQIKLFVMIIFLQFVVLKFGMKDLVMQAS